MNPWWMIILPQQNKAQHNICIFGGIYSLLQINVQVTLRPGQNGRHFADDTFKSIFVYENVRILIEFSLKFVPNGPINNIPALVQIMAWRRPGDKPLCEPMLITLLTHICVIRPQWVKSMWYSFFQAFMLLIRGENRQHVFRMAPGLTILIWTGWSSGNGADKLKLIGNCIGPSRPATISLMKFHQTANSTNLYFTHIFSF